MIDSKPSHPSNYPNRTGAPTPNASVTSTTQSTVSSSVISSSSSSSHSSPNSDDLLPFASSSPSSSAFSSPSSPGDGLDDPYSEPPLPDDCSQHWTYSPEATLRNIFRLVYWTSQLLTWIVLPLMQVWESVTIYRKKKCSRKNRMEAEE